jgi:hypothetical protein
MDYLRRLLSLSRRRLAALSSSILNKVPLELLLYIIDFLLSESAVAFSLSYMHLKCLLGTQHFLKVASSSKDTLALLDLLALDLPNQVVCSPCQRLHNMENLRRYNSATYSAGSTCYNYECLRFCFQDGHMEISPTTRVHRIIEDCVQQITNDNGNGRLCVAIWRRISYR